MLRYGVLTKDLAHITHASSKEISSYPESLSAIVLKISKNSNETYQPTANYLGSQS